MKIDRHGKARCLSPTEIQRLFSEGLQTLRDRCLFGVCLYSACRINEACTLRRADVFDKKRNVRPELIIRKGNTKGKLATRCIPIGEDLRALLTEYNPPSYQWFLFPGRHDKGHIRPDSASRILREAMERIGLEGASTHSFRRTALTTLSNSGVPLRIIQTVSGHRSLEVLEEYLSVSDEQVRGAITALSQLSYVKKLNYLMALDKDGASAGSKILELSGGQPLPHTIAFSSGRSGRCQYLFLVPEQYARAIQTRKFRTGVTGDDGKGEQLELRWKGLQSVLPPSLHPTSGNYFYLEGCAIQECEIAIAPDWMIEAMLIEPTCSVSSAKPAASSTTAVPYQFGTVSPIVDPSILSIHHPDQIPLPVPQNFPLLLGCRKEVRDWIVSGVPKGSGRNDAAIEVGLELIAVEQHLLSINQRFEGSAKQLFSEFCQHSGMTNKEDEERFRWCEGKNPTPSAGTEGVETCIRGWYWREFVKPYSTFANSSSVADPKGSNSSSSNGDGDSKIIRLLSSDLLTSAELEREINHLLAQDIPPSKLEAIIPELARRSNRSEKSVWKLYQAKENELSQAENLETNSGQFKKLIEYSNKTLDLFEVFPQFLANALLTKAKSDQIDPIHLVQNLLPAVGGILGGNIAMIAKQGVSNPDHWREYPVIWTSNISEPSTGKTNAQNTIFNPLKRLQQKEDKRYKEAKKRLKQVEALWQRKSAEQKEKLLDSRENPEVFQEEVVGTRRKWQYDIAQMEAVLRRLSEQEPNTGAVWVKDEQAGLFSGLDQYKSGNKGDSRQILLSMWGGRLFLEIDRVDEDKSFQLSGQTLNMAGGLQPKIASKIFKNQEDSDGLLSRILPAVPQIPDEFSKWSDTSVDLDATIENLYTKLANLPKGVDCRFDPEGKQLWIKRWEALRRGFIHYLEENPAYAYFLGKQCSYVPRLALILHCIEHCYKPKSDFEVISADTLQRAIALSDYYCGQFRLLQATAPQESAEVQLDGLMYKVFDKARKRGGKITTREAQQSLRRDKVKAPALVGVFAAIVATGLATLSDSGKTLVLNENQGVDRVDRLLINDQQPLSVGNKEFQPFVDRVDRQTELVAEVLSTPNNVVNESLTVVELDLLNDQHDQPPFDDEPQAQVESVIDSVDRLDQHLDQQPINNFLDPDDDPDDDPPGGGVSVERPEPTLTQLQSLMLGCRTFTELSKIIPGKLRAKADKAYSMMSESQQLQIDGLKAARFNQPIYKYMGFTLHENGLELKSGSLVYKPVGSTQTSVLAYVCSIYAKPQDIGKPFYVSPKLLVKVPPHEPPVPGVQLGLV